MHHELARYRDLWLHDLHTVPQKARERTSANNARGFDIDPVFADSILPQGGLYMLDLAMGNVRISCP